MPVSSTDEGLKQRLECKHERRLADLRCALALTGTAWLATAEIHYRSILVGLYPWAQHRESMQEASSIPSRKPASKDKQTLKTTKNTHLCLLP